jgi:hypothetical protein
MSKKRLFLTVIGVALLAAVLTASWLYLNHHLPRSIALTELQGTVLDDTGPIAAALVRVQTTDRHTLTDADGGFRLPANSSQRLTAWKSGYFIVGTDLDTHPLALRLTRLPTEDHEAYEWIDPAPGRGTAHNCGNCHAEIYQEWSASAHARSATGKHFLDLYRGTDWDGQPHVGWSLLDEHPLGAGVCAACHAPAIPADDPAQLDLLQVSGTAAKGVHCDYCHKIADIGQGTLGLTHGRFNLKLLRPAPDRGQGMRHVFFGPLDDADQGDDAFAPLYRESRYCASCHEGTVFGVPVYTTYSEWLESPARQAGKQCQTCHMRPTGTMTNFAPNHGGRERDPQTLGNHRFLAGSKEAMLSQAVTASAAIEHREDQARVTVRVTAKDVGHRVPTGFVDRHLVLVVEGSDEAGRSLKAVAGPELPAFAGPDLAGVSGRLYAKLLTDAKGAAPVPFWRDDARVHDNRLTPAAPDELIFDFPEQLSRVRVQVLYRRFWPEVARAKHWPAQNTTVLDRTFAKSDAAGSR